MTHDQSVAATVSRTLEKIAPNNVSSWGFEDARLEREDFSRLDVYHGLLSSMYKVAAIGLEDSPSNALAEGEDATSATNVLASNDVRRVWEAFMHFELGETVTDASVSAKVREYLQVTKPESSDFLDSYPGRV